MATGRFTKLMTDTDKDSQLSGVLSGIGKHLGIDPTLLRIGFVIAFFAGLGGFLLIAYIACAVIFPDYDPQYDRQSQGFVDTESSNNQESPTIQSETPQKPYKEEYGNIKSTKKPTIEEHE